MELNHLRVFYEVAKAGTFTEAARRLNISQSALSRSVALLEDSEGVALFERSKKGVALTKIGTEVFRHCESLFHTVTKIEEACRGIKETCEGPLPFGAADHVVNYLLPQPLRSFRRSYPAVIPSVLIGTPDEIANALLNGDCEFGLSFVKIRLQHIECKALRDEPMALVVHSDIWRECKGPNQAATLDKALTKVGYISSIGAHTVTRASRVLMELFGKMPRIGFETNGQEAQKRICLAGGGVAYLARFMVEREIKEGILHEIQLESPHSFYLWLATRNGHSMSLAAKTFLEHLKSELR